ncbi:hypothetical protein CPB83DRAFT_832320 [Crepidotus variabilis]|uniref:F-box domain-containing protein n=1 Tax=Crepidotus variabilis TaxID=179855 RepID=A0A9P6EQV6_9AGAR|nr:hypothetical protein CPB83DRAFT_832320 [Crepidotus variabilis]
MFPEPLIGRNSTLQEPLDTSKWKAESYRHYDQMIHTTQEILAELGQQRNALLPNVLPVEILTKIFTDMQDAAEEVLDEFSPDVPVPFSVQDYLGAYTSVCRYWQSVALSSPFLWRNILLESGAGGPATVAENFISRSAPLPIRIIYYPKSTPKISPTMVEQLVVPGCGVKKANHYLYNLLQKPLKNLRRLAINCKSTGQFEYQLHILDAPNLRTLSLANADYIPQQQLPKLTHLELKLHCRHELGPFLELLRTMHLLQGLILDHAAPYREEDFVLQRIGLPLIKYIGLKESRMNHREPFVFLQNLALTPNTLINWYDQMTSHEEDDPDKVPPLAMLESVTSLLLESTGTSNSIKGHCMTMNMRQRTGLLPLLRNVRLLARSTGASDNMSWSSYLPNIEEYHIRADAVKTSLIWELERRVNPIFPNLVTLYLWNRPWRSLDDSFGQHHGNTNSELQELKEKLKLNSNVTRTRSDGTTYRIELRDTSDPFLSLDWMLSLGNSIF